MGGYSVVLLEGLSSIIGPLGKARQQYIDRPRQEAYHSYRVVISSGGMISQIAEVDG